MNSCWEKMHVVTNVFFWQNLERKRFKIVDYLSEVANQEVPLRVEHDTGLPGGTSETRLTKCLLSGALVDNVG